MDYVLKASAVTLIFYACYKLFLQRETFFESNRWFLLIGLLASICIPLVVIPIYVEYVPVTQNLIVAGDGTGVLHVVPQPLDWTSIFYTVYGIGLLFLSVKLIMEFSSLLALFRKHGISKDGPFALVETNSDIPPFSFFNYIVYNKSRFDEKELKHIINHEKVHAKQWHSIDIQFCQLLCTLFWFNPIIWLYKKEIQQNLEFIADKGAQTVASCEKSYQTLLLKTSMPNYQLAFANNFYNSLIKKRIVMLHKSKSSKLKAWKYTLVLPVLAILLMSANTKTIYVEKANASKTQAKMADPSYGIEFEHILEAAKKEKNSSKTTSAIKSPTQDRVLTNTTITKPQQDPKAPKAVSDHEMVLITKDFTDSDFEALKQQLEAKGITIKFKGVKRNADNQITAIKIDVNSKNSNANYHIENDDPIHPIKIGFDNDGGRLSIGNSNGFHTGDHAYTYVSKDGKHKIHTAGKGHNVFVYSDDDDDDKIIIRKADKVHYSPKAKGKAHFVSDDGKVTVIADDKVVVRTHDGKENDTIHIKRNHKDKLVWINKKNDTNVYEFDHNGENKFFVATDSGKAPLFILNGKEISKKEMDALNPDTIEKVEVLKGDSATENYGDKGKDGVVLITTKDKD